MKFWYHSVPLALLGLTGEWVSGGIYSKSRVGFALFVSIWTFLTFLAHWTFPFLFAGIWAIATCLLWFIAATVLSVKSCINADYKYSLGSIINTQSFHFCLNDYPRYQAMVAFAWINFLLMISVLVCIWYYVKKTKQVGWRDGLYGRSYYWKPSRSSDMAMKENATH